MTDHLAVLEELADGRADFYPNPEQKDALRAALALMRGQSEDDLKALTQQANAWVAVVGACRAIDNNALASYGPTGRESIVNFIKKLAEGLSR